MKKGTDKFFSIRVLSLSLYCCVFISFILIVSFEYVNAEDAGEIVKVEGHYSTEEVTPGRELTRRPDDERPDEQLKVLLFGRPLTIGGEYDITASYRKDFRLADDAEDDLFRVNQQMEFEFLYEVRKDIFLFIEAKPFYISELYVEDGHPEKEEKGIKRGETWIHFDDISGSDFELQLGRVGFDEKRRWWWDEDLDAIRVYYKKRKLRFELAVAEELFRTSTHAHDIDPEEDDILRLIGHASWRWDKRHRIEFFFLHQDDHSQTEPSGIIIPEDQEDKSDADLFWIGARAHGRYDTGNIGKIYYWLDTALLTGDEVIIDYDTTDDDRSIVDEKEMVELSGWAVDAGITLETELPMRPRFTLGYAVGSGDHDQESGADSSFRQSGLHDNNSRFRGVNSFRYYGELLRPELSNLHIMTIAAGFPLLNDSSIEMLYHRYRQDNAAPLLRNARVKANPLGENKSIGHEWDIVIGIEEWDHIELELIGSVFRSGDAFGPLSGEIASYGSFEFTYNF